MNDEYYELLKTLLNPTIEMKEMGSASSNYDLSQEQAGQVFTAMIHIMLYRLENPE